MITDTAARGLEELVVRAMTGRADARSPKYVATETSGPAAGGTAWIPVAPLVGTRDCLATDSRSRGGRPRRAVRSGSRAQVHELRAVLGGVGVRPVI